MLRSVLRNLGTGALSLPQAIPRWWKRDYRDSRIILEQDGDLHYFQVSGHLQRTLVRTAIMLGLAVTLAMAALALTSFALLVAKSRLEKSHQEVYEALLGSSAEGGRGAGSLRETDMLALAQSIRERDIAIHQYVDRSAASVTSENGSLLAQLQNSGLTEKAVKVIEQSTARGGFPTDANASLPGKLLPGTLLSNIAKNSALLDVLRALPSHMPLGKFEISSEFGMRQHPISGALHFHAGVDLLPKGVDEKVHPAKAGVVKTAHFHPQFGNFVVVSHDHGIDTLYGHLASLLVEEGQKVTTDTVLGLVGNTGASTGKHLHFEVSVGGYPTNPQKVIRTAQNVQQIQN